MTDSEEKDIYQEGASIAFKIPYDQVTRLQRTLFKERFFLFVYAVYRRQTTREDVQYLIKAVAERMTIESQKK